MSEERKLQRVMRVLSNHAWDSEVQWAQIEQWLQNFDGLVLEKSQERLHCLYAATRFVYFSKILLREMLLSLYRDHFAAPIKQRIRRNFRHTRDASVINVAFEQELRRTRFVGVGNPAESGAHLLYYFRQVNRLPKDLFVDLNGAFVHKVEGGNIVYEPREPDVNRYIFFDDLVASGDQAHMYLREPLKRIRASMRDVDIRLLTLFSTTRGLERMNDADAFAGRAETLFELDNTFVAFDAAARYFVAAPDWFDVREMEKVASKYGARLWPRHPLGYNNGQLLLAFSHNTPDNVPPIFWYEHPGGPAWVSAFRRYHKVS